MWASTALAILLPWASDPVPSWLYAAESRLADNARRTLRIKRHNLRAAFFLFALPATAVAWASGAF